MAYRLIILIGIFGTACTFWLYSRLTVDDAFITWRYGKNLVEHGIWNYSPSHFDLTQAYTNPIFAALSIFPSFLNIDVVLFFKIVAVLNLIAFALWYARQTQGSYITLLLLLGMPATIAHAFGGLETFLYVSLMSALYVSLDKHKLGWSIGITLALFVTRPESWLLVALVPLFFLLKEKTITVNELVSKGGVSSYISSLKVDTKNFAIAAAALFIPLVVYLLLNKSYFGYALPNTFYVKSGALFSINQMIKFVFFIFPIVLLLLMGRIKIFLLIAAYSFALALNYSISNLSMNYLARFVFHIFIPIYVFLVYASASSPSQGLLKFQLDDKLLGRVSLPLFTKLIAVLFLLVFLRISGIADAGIVTAYPRLLDSHAALGKTLSQIKGKYQIQSFSLGDAGMVAYHSDIQALDNIGLGSALVTHRGITSQLMDEYQLDVIAFHSSPNEIRLKEYGQQEIFNWASKNNLNYLCDVYYTSDYTLKLYSKIEISELKQVCESSKIANDKTNRSYLKTTWQSPPWRYWTE